MVDFYAGTLLILALASIEIMAMNWIYGTANIVRWLSISPYSTCSVTILRDINYMLDMKLSCYWAVCWSSLCPVLLPLLLLYVLVTQVAIFKLLFLLLHLLLPLQAGVPALPLPLSLMGWIFAFCGLMILPVHCWFSMQRAEDEEEEEEGGEEEEEIKGLAQKLKRAFQPNSSWGPSSIEERRGWEEYK